MSQELSQKQFISSSEGAALLEVDRQSFFYYVGSREVEKRETNSGGKDRYEYSYQDLLRVKDELKSKRASKRKAQEPAKPKKTEGSPAATDWCKIEDLPYIYALDCQLYGIENSAPPTTTLKWVRKNNATIRMIYNVKNRKDIWGTLTLLPMREETIFKILRGEMVEAELESEDILEYELGIEYSCYIASFSILPDKRNFVPTLIKSVIDYWCEHPEIYVHKLYAFALGAYNNLDKENDGLRMIRKLFFSPRYDIAENAWELDLEHYNPSPIIQDFQECIRSKREEVKA